jgi:hypothetical protein
MPLTPEEIQALDSHFGYQGTVTAEPRGVTNLKAAQKGLETSESEAAKLGAARKDADIARQTAFGKIRGSLGAVEKNIETMNSEGGYSPLYENEALMFGMLPGVKPTVQFLRSQGIADLPLVGNVGQALTNRESMQTNTGALAAQLKGLIRGKGEGAWTDKDQEFLMMMLPSGKGYDTDKNIIESLRSGTLINDIDTYRNTAEWGAGLESDKETNPQNWNTGVEQVEDIAPKNARTKTQEKFGKKAPQQGIKFLGFE